MPTAFNPHAFSLFFSSVQSMVLVVAMGLGMMLAGAGGALAQSPDGSSAARETGARQYCVTCYGETNDMTSKRTCYQITAPTQIHMRAFGVRQCTALSGNLWYQFANGSCEGKRYCKKVIKR